MQGEPLESTCPTPPQPVPPYSRGSADWCHCLVQMSTCTYPLGKEMAWGCTCSRVRLVQPQGAQAQRQPVLGVKRSESDLDFLIILSLCFVRKSNRTTERMPGAWSLASCGPTPVLSCLHPRWPQAPGAPPSLVHLAFCLSDPDHGHCPPLVGPGNGGGGWES